MSVAPAIANALSVLKPDANPLTDYRVEDNGTGQRIAYWNVAILGPIPTELEIAEALALYTPPVPTITRKQALLWLLSIGKTDDDIEAAIATIADSAQRQAAAIEWRYTLDYHHNHPLFTALAPIVGIAVEDLPDAFRQAATL